MALSQIAHFALSVAFFGTLAFILGVIAENKKPAAGTPIQGKDVIICKYPSDPTIALGILSIFSLLISTGIGFTSVFFPYKGKAIKKSILFQNMTLLVFFIVALVVFVLAEGMMWATITKAFIDLSMCIMIFRHNARLQRLASLAELHSWPLMLPCSGSYAKC
ncbi:hypothetical protein J5N97_013908 [Dioscorea zingiberensis]|uniref:Uncharacterized protein n=1 Tax=Dioscorea zingiberensis TaxID=325984 RepID=A0A9D5CT46_9LILI|nr:hypothetical protein J5N97_013908 [Dioscorea zingiberensis]